MKRNLKALLLAVLLVVFTITTLVSDTNIEYHPGLITVCFSADLVGNTRGEFNITHENGIVQTPFEWFNDLAEEYQIINLTRKYQVKNREWNLNGQYPMNVFRIESNDHSRTNGLLEALQTRNSDVLFAEKEAVFWFDSNPALQNGERYTPNDPLVSQQYHLTNIMAYEAWDIHTGSPDIVVGAVDSGFKWNHVDLAPNAWVNEAELPGITINYDAGTISGGDGIDNDGNGYIDDVMGWNFWPGQQQNNPVQIYNDWSYATHGTHVAGIIGAKGDNGIGIAGVAYDVSIVATKHQGNIPELYNGVYYMVDTGIRVVNCSWGASGNANDANLAANYAYDHGTLIVAAAGNTYGSAIQYPAGNALVMAVVSTTANDTKSDFSTYGTWTNISAPGTLIYSTYFNAAGADQYETMSGTSMASPVVAGVAGLLLSQNPSLTVDELFFYLQEGADDIDHLNPQYAGQMGAGRVNAFNSISMVQPLEFDLEATSINGLVGAPLNTPAFFTVGLTNLGIEPAQDYVVHLMNVGDDTPLATAQGIYLLFEETGFVEIEWIPTILGEYTLYGLIEWELDQRDRNDKSASMDIRIIPQGTAEAYIGNLNSTLYQNNSFINYSARNSITQTIYPENELLAGSIYFMSVRFTGAHTLVYPGCDIKIYLATTEKTSFENNADWIPFEQFTLVFSGELEVFEVGNYDVIINFDNPFNYESGNLVVLAVKESIVFYGSSNAFQYTPIQDTNRIIQWQSNIMGSPVLDPFPNATNRFAGFSNARFGFLTFDIEPPKNLVADINDLPTGLSATLTWQAPDPQLFGTLQNYKLFKDNTLISQQTALTFTDTAVQYNTEYQYWVTAVYTDPNLESKSSNVITVVAENIKPPINLVSEVVENDTVILTWELGTQASILQPYGIPIGYNVLRNDELLPDMPITETTFTEHKVPEGKHIYSVVAIYQTGESDPVSIEVEIKEVNDDDNPLPIYETALIGNFPNPFNPETIIRFSLAVDSFVSIDIYNIRGQKVKNLLNAHIQIGEHSVIWNGHDENNREVGSGMYFYIMQTEDFSQVKRMMLMK